MLEGARGGEACRTIKAIDIHGQGGFGGGGGGCKTGGIIIIQLHFKIHSCIYIFFSQTMSIIK